MITFFVPIKIVSEGNNTDHWTVKRKRTKRLQWAIKTALMGKELPSLPCDIILERSGPRMLDSDNLQFAFKHVRDYLAKHIIETHQKPSDQKSMPIGWYDSDKRLKWIYGQIKGPIGFQVTIKGSEEHIHFTPLP